MGPTTRRRTLVALAAAGAVTVIASGVAVVATLRREPERVASQGTLHPVAERPPGTPRSTSTTTTSTTTPPPTEAPTTTATVPAPATPSTRLVPAAPTSPPATEAPPAAPPDPFRVRIERIGVDAAIIPVGVDPGTNALEIPGLDDVGWYRFGSQPGDPAGTAVLVGHVDGDGRPGVFANLRELAPGDTFTVTLPDGITRAFSVTGLEQFDKQALPSDLFSRAGPPRLALITCGGPFDATTGHYLDNVVVVAAPA